MAFDPAAVAKYGVAGARRRAQRQALGVSDIRKLTPQQLQSYKQGGSGITKGLGFTRMGSGQPDQLIQAIQRKRKGGPAGGRPVMPQKGGTAGGKPVSAARVSEDSPFRIGPGTSISHMLNSGFSQRNIGRYYPYLRRRGRRTARMPHTNRPPRRFTA